MASYEPPGGASLSGKIPDWFYTCVNPNSQEFILLAQSPFSTVL